MLMELNNPIRVSIYEVMCQHPSWKDEQVAEALNISRSTVWRTRGKLEASMDYQIARKFASQTLLEMEMACDYFKDQIDRIDKLKTQKKTIVVTDEAGSHTTAIPLSPIEVAFLEKQQTELWEKIIFVARQSQGREVLHWIASHGKRTRLLTQ